MRNDVQYAHAHTVRHIASCELHRFLPAVGMSTCTVARDEEHATSHAYVLQARLPTVHMCTSMLQPSNIATEVATLHKSQELAVRTIIYPTQVCLPSQTQHYVQFAHLQIPFVAACITGLWSGLVGLNARLKKQPCNGNVRHAASHQTTQT